MTISLPATRPRPVLAVAIVLAVIAALWWQSGQGANAAPAAPWHYPCVMHVEHAGGLVIESFTPYPLLTEGKCLQ